jgi:hypothetical protein
LVDSINDNNNPNPFPRFSFGCLSTLWSTGSRWWLSFTFITSVRFSLPIFNGFPCLKRYRFSLLALVKITGRNEKLHDQNQLQLQTETVVQGK